VGLAKCLETFNLKAVFRRKAQRELKLYALVNLLLWECRELSTTWSAKKWDTDWEQGTFNLWMMQWRSVCSILCMQYSVYAALGVCCTLCQCLILAWRDRDGWLNLVFIGDGRVEDEKERDLSRYIAIMRNQDSREFCMQVNLPFRIPQGWVLSRHVTTLIRGLLNQIRHVVPLISHIRSYLQYHSYLHPPSLFLAHNSTIIARTKS
jgi:hypothetical protein